jgi:hypothetical protein
MIKSHLSEINIHTFLSPASSHSLTQQWMTERREEIKSFYFPAFRIQHLQLLFDGVAVKAAAKLY